MKRMVAILLLIILISTFVSATSYNARTPAIKAYLESVSPYPVEPGQDFTIQIRISNEGGEIAEDVKAEIEYGEYFFLKSKEDDFDELFNLCTGCSKDNTYYFVVSPDTLSGEYPISVKFNRAGAITEKKVFVRVIGQPDIIFNTKLLNDKISPDSSFDVILNIKNVGTGIARNIKLEPTSSGFVIGGSNLVFIKELKPNEEINKTVQVMTTDSLSTEPSKLNFKLTYKNEKSNQTTLNQALGIRLLDKVKLDLAAVIVDPQPLIKGQKATVTVRVENLGEGQAENIQVLLKNNGFEGQTKAYIGKLDEGEDAPAVFTLIPSKTGEHELEVKVTYEDDLGQHQLTESLELLVLGRDYTWIGIFATIIIVGTGLFAYKLFWRKKEGINS